MSHFIFCIVCGSDKLENKELGLCASHNKERRDKENARPKVVKQVKKISEKKADELSKYPKLKSEFLEFKMVCELNFAGCTKRTTDVHHCSISARNFLNVNTWKSVCRNCHSYLETNVSAEKRREMGLLTD